MADILKEIQQEIKEEKYEKLIVEHGPKLIIIAVLVIVCTFFYSFYKKQQNIKNMEAGSVFYTAYNSSKIDLYKKAETSQHKNFSALADLQVASINISKEKYSEAQKALEGITKSEYPERSFLDIANIAEQYSDIKSKNTAPEKIENSLVALAGNSVFKYTALELLGAFYLEQNKIDEAKKIFTQISGDNNCPVSARDRATVVLKTL